MRHVILLLALLAAIAVVPTLARQDGAPASPKSVEIAGTVQSFSSNILDVKPADSPSVWITIPAEVKVDPSALKAGAKVVAKAYWVGTCYVATEVAVQK
jgi:hypothetical protein